MRFAKVVGTTVSTAKDPGLGALKLLLCVPCAVDGSEEAGAERFVAADTVGAGVGEVVLVAFGSAARVTARTERAPTDATVVGIVDSIQVGSRTVFRKG